jgi:hypothetical protein
VSILRRDKPDKPDSYVQDRALRAEGRMRELAPLRNECWQFARGNSYVFRTQENTLVQQATTVSARGRGKPPHRVRSERPILVPLIRQEVSHATQRVPSYHVTPSNTDPSVVHAAGVAEQVALYGYDKWKIQDATADVVMSAIVADEGFAWPYWDTCAGPPIGVDPASDTLLYQGEVCVRTFTANEVGWEPGVRFEDSRYYLIVQARPVDEVLAMPGCLVTGLSADATDRQLIGTGKPSTGTRLVLVKEYLERPSKKHPMGRRIVMANGGVILPEEDYPLTDVKGHPVDQPVLHKLSVIRDPDSDHDLGMVRFALDAIRTFNDANNKAIEWKNLALNPQVLAPPGTILQPLTDEPGAVFECTRPDLVSWRPVPQVPRELFEMADRARADLAFIFSQNDIPSGVEAAAAIQTILTRDQNARALFLKYLADFHSRLMHDCLVLVAKHYSEPRLLEINGGFTPDVIPDFVGSDLMSQVAVRVTPDSLEPYTRDSIERKVFAYADRGWISPQAAMSAIDNGSAEGLVKDYELHLGRADLIIRKIKLGPEVLFGTADNPDGTPGWMPRRFDKVEVHKQRFEMWFMTAEYDHLDIGQKEAANLYYDALLQIEAQKQAEAMAAQAAQAEQLGLNNAARPQGFKPSPDMPAPAAPTSVPS